MKYCKACFYPDPKPDLFFNDAGICSACTAYRGRGTIDWKARQEDFLQIVEKTKQETVDLKRDYDCIIPVSGGKDSFYQVLTAKKYGLKPLAVNAETCSLTDIGGLNLNALSMLGVDMITVSPDKLVRKKLNKYALETVGDISWPEHVLIFTVPLNIANKYGINIIIYGENPQNEYGGPENEQHATELKKYRWLSEFGGLNGLRVSDIINNGVATESQMAPYMYPKSSNASQIFLGQYFPWDGFNNYIVARDVGMEVILDVDSTSGYGYENLDNYQTGIHDYFKYLKFGFGRCTDISNNHLRRGRMERSNALSKIKKYDHLVPYICHGQSLEVTLRNIGISMDEFQVIKDRFTNSDLFDIRDDNGITTPVPKFVVGEDS